MDALDIAAWINGFRQQAATPTAEALKLADLDGNGSEGAEDLSLILRNFSGSGDI